jgi:TRAP transporter TAXI family solute receptor
MKLFGAWRAVSLAGLVVLALSAISGAQDSALPRAITLGTASPGGPYIAYGEGLARILTRSLGIEVTAQVTQGPAQNIVLMEKKEATLGFITMGAGIQGWNGTDWAKGTQYRSMRVIFPMFDTAFQFVALKSLGIHSLDQLANKRVGVGPRVGTAGTYMPEIFKALAIPVSIRYGSWDDMKAQALADDLDAICFVGGVPFPALKDLAAAQPVDFIEPSAQQVAIIKKQLPEISPSLVKKGTYASLAADYSTIGLYNFAIAHKDLPDDLVYRIVKAVFDNNTEMIKFQLSARETIPTNIDRDTMLPLHPGAARYYREAGIPIPVVAASGN